VRKRDENYLALEKLEDIPPATETTLYYLSNYLYQYDGAILINIPGDSINHHSSSHNITNFKVSDNIMGIMATKDIECGKELLMDYHDYGTPPQWLVEFAKRHKILLLFEGYSEFIGSPGPHVSSVKAAARADEQHLEPLLHEL